MLSIQKSSSLVGFCYKFKDDLKFIWFTHKKESWVKKWNESEKVFLEVKRQIWQEDVYWRQLESCYGPQYLNDASSADVAKVAIFYV